MATNVPPIPTPGSEPEVFATTAAVRSSTYESILVSIEGRVARLVLNKPPYNAMTIKMMQEVTKAIEALHDQHEVRVIVVEASPECKYFSAGVAVQDATPQRAFQMMEAFQGIFRAMLEISKPVVTVVNGPAVGAGCELAVFGDMVIATEKAQFAQPEIRLGVFPPVAAIMLPHLIGPKRALEMIVTAEPIKPPEALKLGLVNRVVLEANLKTEVDAILAKITDQSSAVLEMAKRVMFETMGMTLQQAMKHSASLYLNQLMDLEDAQEGLMAIVEKRKPVWKNK
jgi:cyclohexa-1,5-dienecarbonyl-CoA hydratase